MEREEAQCSGENKREVLVKWYLPQLPGKTSGVGFSCCVDGCKYRLTADYSRVVPDVHQPMRVYSFSNSLFIPAHGRLLFLFFQLSLANVCDEQSSAPCSWKGITSHGCHCCGKPLPSHGSYCPCFVRTE